MNNCAELKPTLFTRTLNDLDSMRSNANEVYNIAPRPHPALIDRWRSVMHKGSLISRESRNRCEKLSRAICFQN